MALIFEATGRDEPAAMPAPPRPRRAQYRPPRASPLVRALVLRGLEMAGEVALGRAKLSEVTRAAVRPEGS